MELQGTIKKIGDIKTFDSGFQKRELVILAGMQYPQPIIIEFFKDKISLLDDLKIDDEVTVHINIGGREWTSPQGEVKYFNSITGWKISKEDEVTRPKEKKEEPFIEDDNDLPF